MVLPPQIIWLGLWMFLKHYVFQQKALFDVFCEHLSNYIITNVKNRGDVVAIVKNLEDPEADFKTKYLTSKPNDADKKNLVIMGIFNEKELCEEGSGNER